MGDMALEVSRDSGLPEYMSQVVMNELLWLIE